MKKFVLSSIVALGVMSCGSAFGADCLAVPEGFERYDETGVVDVKREKILGEWFSVSYYDREGDGVNDVAEIRSTFDVGKLLYCGFDTSRDGVFSFGELVAAGESDDKDRLR